MNGFAFLSAEQISKLRTGHGQLEYVIDGHQCSNSKGELHLDCKMTLADHFGKECVLFISRQGNYYVITPERPEELLCASSPKSMGYANSQKSVLDFQKNGWVCGCPDYVPNPKGEMIDLAALTSIGEISEEKAEYFFKEIDSLGQRNKNSDPQRHLKQIYIVNGVRMTYAEMMNI